MKGWFCDPRPSTPRSRPLSGASNRLGFYRTKPPPPLRHADSVAPMGASAEGVVSGLDRHFCDTCNITFIEP